MRMSSGAASAQYEKPRTGRSSCGLLTPRSNKMPTMFPSLLPAMPVLPTMCATSSKPPCTMRARSPKGSSAAPAASTATGSRSMPRSLEIRSGTEDLPRVPPATDGHVHHDPGRYRKEQLHHLFRHHRLVLELLRRHLAFFCLLLSRTSGRLRGGDPGAPRLRVVCSSRPPPAPRTRRRKQSGRKGRLRRIARGAGGGPAGSPLSRFARYRNRADRRTRSGRHHRLPRARATAPGSRSRCGRTRRRRRLPARARRTHATSPAVRPGPACRAGSRRTR